ncbi:hypothetical protein GCM10027568_00510 [Humibacter soli]
MSGQPDGLRRRRKRPPVESVADVAQRLAVLLAAGVSPTAAWQFLSESAASEATAKRRDDGRTVGTGAVVTTREIIAAAAVTASRGGDVARSISSSVDRPAGDRARSRRDDQSAVRSAWSGLAAALRVATESGTPMAEALRVLAGALRDVGQTQRDRAVALAGPGATARTVIALPVVGLLFGAGLGFDTLHILFATAAGIGCLIVGVVLMLLAHLWNRALVRRATPRESMPGLALELVAMAMGGGGSVPAAVTRATDACVDFGLDPPSDDAVRPVLTLAERAGVGAVELLRAEAEQLRRDARSSAQEASASLAVRLMAPLAVCVLPAFMLLSVAPLVMSILSSTLGGL